VAVTIAPFLGGGGVRQRVCVRGGGVALVPQAIITQAAIGKAAEGLQASRCCHTRARTNVFGLKHIHQQACCGGLAAKIT
jgi:hypothetical protein